MLSESAIIILPTGPRGPDRREEKKMKNYQKEYELRQAKLDAWIIYEFRVALQNAERARGARYEQLVIMPSLVTEEVIA